MKYAFKIYPALLLLLAFVFGCDTEREFQELTAQAPSNIGANFNIISDNSGTVTISPKGEAVTEFNITFGDGSEKATVKPGGMVSHVYAEGDFTVVIEGVGVDGTTASASQELSIRFDPPENVTLEIVKDSRQVTVTPDADKVTVFDVYFGVEGEEPMTILPGESATYLYEAIGTYTIRVVARGAGVASTEVTEEIEVFDRVLMPLDFESTTVGYAFAGFGGGSAAVIDNPDMSEPNASAKVVEFVKAEGGEVWGGVTIDISEPLNFNDFKKVKMSVWSPKVGATVLFKAEQIGNPDVFAEVSMSTTVANQWEELIFDFSGLDPDADLRRLAFFFDFGVNGDGSAFYFDNVQMTNEGAQPLALPIDFENPNVPYAFASFGGANAEVVDNPAVGGANSSAKVAKMNKSDGAEVWAGALLELPTPVDFSQEQSFSVKTWSPKAGATVRLKLENATDPGVFVETDATTGVANDWEVLTFDFSGFDLSREYHKVVLFFDFGNNGDGSDYYFDDIALGAPAGDRLTMPVNFESATLAYGFTNFGNATSEVVDNPDMSGINTSSKVGKTLKASGAEVWAGSFLELEENIDFDNFKQVNVKVWSPKAGIVVKVKVENLADGSIAHEVDMVTTTSGAWEQLSYDFSGINTANTYGRLVIFFDFGNPGDESTYYFDDFTLGDVAPPPADRLVMPVDFESSTISYTFTDFGNAFSEVVDNPDMSGINTSGRVGKTFKQAGSEVWAGGFLELEENIDFENFKTIKVKVWSPKSGAVVKVKVENLADGSIAHEVDMTTTTSNAWEELSYDFSGIDTSNSYGRLVIFFDFGNNGDDSDYYFDDFRLE